MRNIARRHRGQLELFVRLSVFNCGDEAMSVCEVIDGFCYSECTILVFVGRLAASLKMVEARRLIGPERGGVTAKL